MPVLVSSRATVAHAQMDVAGQFQRADAHRMDLLEYRCQRLRAGGNELGLPLIGLLNGDQGPEGRTVLTVIALAGTLPLSDILTQLFKDCVLCVEQLLIQRTRART